MKASQIAAQLYTCRDLLKTPADIAKTLARLRACGYEAVQLSGMGPIDAGELVQILEGEGIVCCATHEDSATILESPEAVADWLEKLGCKLTAYPFPRGVDMTSAEAVGELIRKLDAAGAVLARRGITLCYHNHHHEFYRVGRRTVLERIYAESDARHLQAEIDTYWVQYGGGDPVVWCEMLKGRLPIIHLKDYQITAKSEPQYCEIGEGNLDFKKIVAAAEASGCTWFAVEQDVCPGDPIESLAISFRYLSEHIAC
jgi:sugar phosphate isomerase/epimerase